MGQNRGTEKLTWGNDRNARTKKMTGAAQNRGTETPTWGNERNARTKKMTGAAQDRKLEELAGITGRNIGFRGE